METHRGTEETAVQPDALGGGAPVKRKPGRKKGDHTPAAQVLRQEKVKEALEYRTQGFTYQQIAAQLGIGQTTAFRWVSEALAAIPAEAAAELRKMALDRCDQIMQQLMPLLDDGPPDLAVIDKILDVQEHVLRLCGLWGGKGGVGVDVVLGGEDGDSEAAVIARIKASAPVLQPASPVPAGPLL